MKHYVVFFFLSFAFFSVCKGSSFVVKNGVTVTDTQELTDPGDTGLIEPEGTIDVSTTLTDAIGVHMANDDQKVTNQGTIEVEAEGFDAYGIYNEHGNNVSVTNQGTIEVETVDSDAYGIYNSVGNNVSVTNRGSIDVSALFQGEGSNIYAYGIYNDGGNNVSVTNCGSIDVASSSQSRAEGAIYAYGIFNDAGDNVTVTNCGSIDVASSSQGLADTVSYGISNQGGDNVTVTNCGRIDVTSSSQSTNAVVTVSYGISNEDGDNVTVTNCGRIGVSASGAGTGLYNAYGIRNQGKNATITNSGRIDVSASAEVDGIFNDAENVTITNTGLIKAEGLSNFGIHSIKGNNIFISNEGTIDATNGTAIFISGLNPTLTLLPCSKIIGEVTSNIDLLDLNVEKGINVVLTLAEGSQPFGNLDINEPYVKFGQTIAALDPRNFALQADVVSDLSDTLLNGIYSPCRTFCLSCFDQKGSIWAQGIGSLRKRSIQGDEYRYREEGFLAGYDFCYNDCIRLNLFGGAVFGKKNNDRVDCTFDLKSNNYVGGVSVQRDLWHGYLGLSTVMGSLSLNQKRYVFNNLAEDGLVKARSNRRGFFLTQDVTLRQKYAICCFHPTFTGTIRYAGFFPGCHNEKAYSSNEETVNSWDLHLNKHSVNFITTRALVGLEILPANREEKCNLEPFIGIAGRFQLGHKRYGGELFEERIDFSTGLSRNIGGFLFGVKGCYQKGCVDLFVNFEGNVEGNKGRRFIGSGGLSYSF